ncbi:CpaB family protein [Nocardioides flavus (ex Wang et al. 2016)]|uniref:flagellar biosynthesis protein FlgA n=1 Tax=Nocardioides flavus (ex Wang et al. 2016) TaxID=2058780 RepID=UPI0017491139|nr:flagellar biosynthesis protein FlgA [Nocardioides flavus (ex Wang et al. 2016)]
MPRNTSRTRPRSSAHVGQAGEVPAATRAAPPGWRDPRLWVGVVLVTGSVVAGARVLAGADDMTPVWAASSDLLDGQTLTADDLRATHVRFDEEADRDRYLEVADELPATLTLTRPLAAGELVPEAALGEEGPDDTVAVSIAVAAEHLPTDVARGSRVDVWVIADRTLAQRRSRGGAELVLGDIAVLDAPVVTDAFASATTRQLVLAVPGADEESLGVLLAASGDDRVRVVGR